MSELFIQTLSFTLNSGALILCWLVNFSCLFLACFKFSFNCLKSFAKFVVNPSARGTSIELGTAHEKRGL